MITLPLPFPFAFFAASRETCRRPSPAFLTQQRNRATPSGGSKGQAPQPGVLNHEIHETTRKGEDMITLPLPFPFAFFAASRETCRRPFPVFLTQRHNAFPCNSLPRTEKSALVE